jgi:hypothetical protein
MTYFTIKHIKYKKEVTKSFAQQNALILELINILSFTYSITFFTVLDLIYIQK